MLNTSLARPIPGPGPGARQRCRSASAPTAERMRPQPPSRHGRSCARRRRDQPRSGRSLGHAVDVRAHGDGPHRTRVHDDRRSGVDGDGRRSACRSGAEAPRGRRRGRGDGRHGRAPTLASMRRMVEGEALASREQVVGARERFLALATRSCLALSRPSIRRWPATRRGQLPLVSVIEAAQALWSAQGELISAAVRSRSRLGASASRDGRPRSQAMTDARQRRRIVWLVPASRSRCSSLLRRGSVRCARAGRSLAPRASDAARSRGGTAASPVDARRRMRTCRRHGGTPPPGYAPVTIDPRSAPRPRSSRRRRSRSATSRETSRTVGMWSRSTRRAARTCTRRCAAGSTASTSTSSGSKVNAGEPLCSIYSQEVYSAEIEFLSVLGRSAAQGGLGPAPRRGPPPARPLGRAQERDRAPRADARAAAHLPAARAARRASSSRSRRSRGCTSIPRSSSTRSPISRASGCWSTSTRPMSPTCTSATTARLTHRGRVDRSTAQVSFLAPTIDEATRTRKVRFELRQRGRPPPARARS